LTPKTSLGFEVIEFWDWLRDRLEELDAAGELPDDADYFDLVPRALEWQRWLLIHALELLEGSDSIPRFRTVLLLVARQNGKSVLLTILILWRMFQTGARMVLETHASLDHAQQAWDDAVMIAEAIPELADEIARKHVGKGSTLLELDGGERFKIASANRRGGRGFRGDLIIFDELREHRDWAAWSATSKTTMARNRAQVWGVSNAGDMSSVVLRHLRAVAVARITGKVPDGVPEELLAELDLDSIGLFEWSAGTVDGTEDGAPVSVWDRDGWARANPSMGYTQLDERAIAAAALEDPEWEFRTEVLCQFVNTMGAGPFPNGAWSVTALEKAKRDESRPVAYGMAMSHDRTWVHIAVAFWTVEGRCHVDMAASAPGVDWPIKWMKDPKRRVPVEHLALQTRGAPISSMVDALEQAGFTVTPWEGRDLAGWHGTFYDLVRAAVPDDAPANETDEERLARLPFTHGIHPNLDIAANSAAIKAIGDGWVLDLKASPDDAAPLQAAIAAVGLLSTNPEPPFESAYEHGGLLVLD
jgi:hypothetical protein